MRYSRPIAPCYFRIFSKSEDKQGKPYKFERYLLSEITQRKLKIVSGEGIMFTLPAFWEACNNLINRGGNVESILFPRLMSISNDFEDTLVKGVISKDLVDIFSNNNYYLSLEGEIKQITKDRWKVIDNEIVYTIRKGKNDKKRRLNIYLFTTTSKQFRLSQRKLEEILKNIVEDISEPTKYGCDIDRALPQFWERKKYINWYLAPGRPKKTFYNF
jgi:hypothetical protein